MHDSSLDVILAFGDEFMDAIERECMGLSGKRSLGIAARARGIDEGLQDCATGTPSAPTP